MFQFWISHCDSVTPFLHLFDSKPYFPQNTQGKWWLRICQYDIIPTTSSPSERDRVWGRCFWPSPPWDTHFHNCKAHNWFFPWNTHFQVICASSLQRDLVDLSRLVSSNISESYRSLRLLLDIKPLCRLLSNYHIKTLNSGHCKPVHLPRGTLEPWPAWEPLGPSRQSLFPSRLSWRIFLVATLLFSSWANVKRCRNGNVYYQVFGKVHSTFF